VISLAEARAFIIGQTTPLAAIPAPLAELHGRILREEVRAREEIPAFDRSAMDGYALADDDPAERFRIVAEIQPGAMPDLVLQAGECARIFTGAAIPWGASQVLMQEEARREGDWMIPLRRSSRMHIRRRGEDAHTGDLMLKPGARVGAGEAALLAQIGVTQAAVSPLPRVIHITTGGELVPPEAQPAPGQIRDSNSTLIAALLAAHGAALLVQRHCCDRLDELLETVRRQPEGSWDLLLISGGASVGDYDFGARALEALGFTIHFRRLNLKPGKPLIFASREKQVAFVLPGNPVSHFVTFHLAVRLALECLTGAEAAWPLTSAVLTEPLQPSSDPRETWSPARLELAGEPRITALRWQSSGDLCGLAGCNALLQIPSGSPARNSGEKVNCLWLEHRP
jgi:molybdopterin molybdotransferase